MAKSAPDAARNVFTDTSWVVGNYTPPLKRRALAKVLLLGEELSIAHILDLHPPHHLPRDDPEVIEIRVHTGVEHRIFYVAKFEEAVCVLHAFEKRTRQTPQPELALARKRFGDLIRRRARKPETQ